MCSYKWKIHYDLYWCCGSYFIYVSIVQLLLTAIS